MAQAKELFEAYQSGELPQTGGYIVSVFYSDNSTYTKYEVVSFSGVKDIYSSEEGLTFQAEGRKIYVLVEPANYPNKHTEPAYRTDAERIPYRQKELISYTTRRQDQVYVGREPVVTYTSFTILKPVGQDVSYIFYPAEDTKATILEFFRNSLWKQARVPQTDARKVVTIIGEVFQKIEVKEEFDS